MSKKVSYMGLLKEAISEADQAGDTTKTVDIKGPMLDPIVSYRGGGEMPTHKDAASILERYYFKEENDEGVEIDDSAETVDEHVDNEIAEVPETPAATKKDISDEVGGDEPEQKKLKESDDGDEDDKDGDSDPEEKEETATESLENSVIEKLIAEMEEDDKEDDAEATNEVDVPGDEGEGTEAAGTGDAEKNIPDRKENPAVATEMDAFIKEMEEEASDDAEKEEEEEEVEVNDIDAKTESVAGSGLEKPAQKDELEEAFQIFKEEVEDEEDDKEVEDVKTSDAVV